VLMLVPHGSLLPYNSLFVIPWENAFCCMIPSLELPSSIDTFIVFFTPRNYLLHSRIFYIIVLTVLINGLKFAEFDKKKDWFTYCTRFNVFPLILLFLRNYIGYIPACIHGTGRANIILQGNNNHNLRRYALARR